MTRHYTVSFIVDVDLQVEDEVMDRALSEDFPYSGMDEEGTIEMLARCIGIYGLPLSTLDGWADMSSDDAQAMRSEITLEDWDRLPDVE